MRFRQYIPVKASGGGGESPDPAVYCPANGYIIDPDLPTPPIYTIPEIETDEKIVLIISSQLESAISHKCTVSNSGQYTTAVYDLLDNLASTANTNNNVILNLNLDTAWGTLHPDGYYLFKVVITPTIATNHILTFANQARTGYAANGWPLLEAHFYTPYLTSLNSAFAVRCKILKYVKFYTACDVLESLVSAFSQCSLLKECYLPTSMNLLTTAQSCFYYSIALRIVVWPETLPECINLSWLYRNGGLKKMTPTENNLPASLPKLETIGNMFEYNHVIEEIEFESDMPLLTVAVNFVIWSTSIRTCKFTGTVGDPASGCNFDWVFGYNYDNLTEFQYPPVIPKMILSSQSTTGQTCYNLKKITYPVEMNHVSTSVLTGFLGNLNNCLSLEEITEITAGGNDYCHKVFLLYTKKITSWWQPKIKLYGFTMNGPSSSIPYPLSSFECDWANVEAANSYGQTISFGFRYMSFEQPEIDRIFNALPTLTGAGTIDFRNNPGYATCDKTIATAKGWTVL